MRGNKTTREKYASAIHYIHASGGCDKFYDVAKQFHMNSALLTVLRRDGWLTRSKSRNGRRYKWTGPKDPTSHDIQSAITRALIYAERSRENAPSQAPGARQMRRLERIAGQSPKQGRRNDVVNYTRTVKFKASDVDNEWVEACGGMPTVDLVVRRIETKENKPGLIRRFLNWIY